jgi:hypothetical protein
MNAEQMQRAIAIEANAKRLKKQFDTYVLLRKEGWTQEVLNVGDPVQFKEGQYNRIEVPIPEEARRFVFRCWRKEIALKFNEAVRELAQLGMTTDLRLIKFSPATGEPL